MLRQAILLEVRKQIGPFLSLLLLILLSVVTVMVVTYVSTGYVMSQTLEISCTFTIIAGSLLLPFYLGSSWGASLKREPIASIEEVLPVSSRIRKVAALSVSALQFCIIVLLAVLASAFIEKTFYPTGWLLVTLFLLYVLSITFLCSYRTNNAWSGIALSIPCLFLSYIVIGFVISTLFQWYRY